MTNSTLTSDYNPRPAPYLTCRLELKEILASFLDCLGQYNPCLALLHIPGVFDMERTCDISTMFPAHTTVVKCMDSLLGSSKSLSRQELQALLFKTPARYVVVMMVRRE